MRLMRKALAVGLAVAMTLAQACAAPAQSIAPYANSGASGASGAVAAPTANTGGVVADRDPPTTHLDTTGYRQDRSTSQAVTDYLTQHKLPLVGAQVFAAPDGTRAVVLYGFAGSEMGRQDAVVKARRYLKDSTVAVDNRVKVNPDLLTANNPGATTGQNPDDAANSSADADDTSANPGADSYSQHQTEAQQYAQQAQQAQQAQSGGSAMSAMTPMLLIGLVALSIASGGQFSIGSGSGGMGPGGPPFGGAPYNPYQGYPSGAPPGSGGP